MSDTTAATVHTSLRLRQALDARLDRVVTLARELLANPLFTRGDDHRGTFREAQLRNAVVVAGGTESLEAIKSWVRYQVGREAGRGGWRHRDFGEALVRHIEQDLAALAEEVATAADASAERATIHVALTRQFLGYLHRHFVFAEMERQRERRTAQAARGSGR
jgi:hypothetical protein